VYHWRGKKYRGISSGGGGGGGMVGMVFGAIYNVDPCSKLISDEHGFKKKSRHWEREERK
jgi:hypothetical protein